METSGYQPVSPEPEEPTEQPGGFSPGPLPTVAPAAEEGSWAYSFVADQAPDATAAPVRSVLDGPEPTLYPEPAVAPTYSLEDPVAPATSSGYADPPSHRKEEPTTVVPVVAPPPSAPVAHLVPAPAAPDVKPPIALAPFPTDVRPSSSDQTPVVKIAESEASEEAYQRTTTEVSEEDDISLNDLLVTVLDSGASDLHLTSGARPALRINGELIQMEDQPLLTPPVIQRVMYAALTQKQREKFEENLELDFAYSVPGRARFRVNIYRQRDALGAAFRIIPFEIKKLEDLGVPPSVANFAQLARGFVLVTGPTGSGKSTTLASLIDMANRTRSEHIMTVEDPIEFLHRHRKCLVNQREVGEDTWSFANALKHVLRQDPDIILVGEMRDLETISVALTAAETGHLVFATLHTQDAAQTIDRIIDVFPPGQQQQVRVQLAGTLQGIVCQTLARTTDGEGRAVATEVLVATPAVRNLIREGKTHQIYSAMQAGAKHGMHTMDQHLADLVKTGRISMETGIEKCHHIEDFNRLAGRA